MYQSFWDISVHNKAVETLVRVLQWLRRPWSLRNFHTGLNALRWTCNVARILAVHINSIYQL